MNLLPVETGRVGLAIAGGLDIDLVTGENTGVFTFVPVTIPLSDAVRFNLNAGWLYERPDDLHWLTWGASVEWTFAKAATLIAEVFGQAGHDVLPASVRNPRFQAGVRFLALDNVDIDVIYGRNITGEDANWITLGLNVRFDARPGTAR
jgi:hypothetical protein